MCQEINYIKVTPAHAENKDWHYWSGTIYH